MKEKTVIFDVFFIKRGLCILKSFTLLPSKSSKLWKNFGFWFKLEGKKVIYNPTEVSDHDFKVIPICLSVLFSV